ncbi:helix-turn-helix transcriptional regulator [Tumebacillus sp. ITR2]|uniref:Helix-turn-helix transcriptional regulator n=1 Tax=Tumebacillus amylolyticus TaxID=2801339 RepID=A0ABS1JC58_9BACL|nr:helix-turn-helix transcriptional regulator [Tumebacillus amylolyticus]MBL0387865.1 helix-turn-helix transcriptional regulator [Tumebacillus amylolyticus]
MIDGKFLAQRRMQMLLSQTEVAKGICTPSMLSQVENNKDQLSFEKMKQLCERLNLELEIKQGPLPVKQVKYMKRSDLVTIFEHIQSQAPVCQSATEFGEHVIKLLREQNLINAFDAERLCWDIRFQRLSPYKVGEVRCASKSSVHIRSLTWSTCAGSTNMTDTVPSRRH